jgi:16S rRNA (guanine1207-N2)-methyltransferase
MGTSHYFDADPGTASAPRAVTLALPDRTVALRTDRGVFSAGRVDPGTHLLLLEAPPPPPVGDVLDLGCGYGPIAVVQGLRSPAARVWAVDVNARARALTADNARLAGAANVTVAAPEEVPPGLRFAAVYSNPPIRIGKAGLHALLTEWVPRGDVAWLVVSKHLGSDSLAAWMSDQLGWGVARRVSRASYRVLEVRPRR